MNIKPILLLTSAIFFSASSALLTGCSTLQHQHDTLSHKEKAIALLESFETGNLEALNYISADSYTQHNLSIPDGRDSLEKALSSFPPGTFTVDVIRAFEDEDYVFLHSQFEFNGPTVAFDVFRFEEGLIVEHWDALTKLAENPNPSGRTQLDGPTIAEDLEKTEENKALVSDFVSTILITGDMSNINQFIGPEDSDYLQHNTMIGDGLNSLILAFNDLKQKNIDVSYQTLHKVLGEGNFVLAISEGTYMESPAAFYDLFRIENGRLAEHWDIIETIPDPSEWKNDNGKFGFQ